MSTRPMIEMTAALLLFLTPLAWSPGPGNMFFAALGARDGFAATLPANAGYHAATFIVTLAVGFGFAAISHSAPGLMKMIGLAGAAYVLRIAWKIARSGAASGAGEARSATFTDGALLLVLNPKAWLIIALMFSQFAAGSPAAIVVVWIATVFTLNNLVAFSVWTLAGDAMARLARSDIHARRMNVAFGLALAAVAVWMALR